MDNSSGRGERGPKGDPGNGLPDGTPFWLRMAFTVWQKAGLATLIVMVGGYWLCTRIAEPLMVTYAESVRVQSKVLQDQSVSLDKISKTLEERVEQTKELRVLVDKFSEGAMTNQAQLLRDHQDIMADLRKSRPGG